MLAGCSSTRSRPLGTGVILNDDPTKRIDTAAAIARLQYAVEIRKVDSMAVFHIAEGVEYPISVSSHMLEAAAHCCLLTKREGDIPATEFLDALRRAKLAPSDRVADLRWGCVFCDEGGSRILSVYFDAKGQRGVIDGACYTFESPALTDWVQSLFPKGMK